MKKLLVVGALAAALCVSCTQPKFVLKMTHRDGDKTFKALTIQGKAFSSPEYGVVKCNMAEDGALSQCRTMTVNFDM